MKKQQTKQCDECGSRYLASASEMASLCPECAHILYGKTGCEHIFKNNRCEKCFWDGSRSEYINTIQGNKENSERKYKNASSAFSTSHMSNAKWVRLFETVIDCGIEIEVAEWSFIDTENKISVSFPGKHGFHYERFADGKFQPFEYKWIKQVFIPHEYKPQKGVGYTKKQDTHQLFENVLSGKFNARIDSDGVYIIAYE